MKLVMIMSALDKRDRKIGRDKQAWLNLIEDGETLKLALQDRSAVAQETDTGLETALSNLQKRDIKLTEACLVCDGMVWY
jgi:hypothetical protein